MSIPYTATSLAIKGYSESPLAKSERADCVVRAIASAFDIPERLLRIVGRLDNSE